MKTNWINATMKDICNVNQGFQINISDRQKHKKDDNKIYITIQHLNREGDNEYIKDCDHNDSVICSKDDVLMTRTGNTGKVITGVEGVFHNNFFKINFDREKIDKDYLVYYLSTKQIQNMILAKAGTSTIPDLNHGDFYSIPFIYPKEIEKQKEISKILKNIDSLINKIEKSIIKKENLKRGLMDDLLIKKGNVISSKIEWRKYKLGDILSYEQPGKYIVNNTNYVSSGVPVLTAGKTFLLGYTNENFGIYNKGKCIIFDDFTTSSKLVDFDFKVKSSAMKILTPKTKEIDLDFVYYMMEMVSYNAVDHQRQWISIYSKIEIDMPIRYEDQKAISNIISNVNNDIISLKNKKNKYIKIKDGVSERLLSGNMELNYE